jgi:anti-sigma regulatory factor (Ser/Thr protein kinase)
MPKGEMYGLQRIQSAMESSDGGAEELIDRLLVDLHRFTGNGTPLEDDITMVALHRQLQEGGRTMAEPDDWCTLAEFELNSELGNERLAMARTAQIAIGLAIPAARREQLEYAVGEAVKNAIEHGNAITPEVPVRVSILMGTGALMVRVTDRGVGGAAVRSEVPDLDAKLAGQQSPRGWGLFLIEQMVDEFRMIESEQGHAAELILHLSGPQ